METTQTIGGRRTRAGLLLALAVLPMAGCGSESDYRNDPRPPAPINITASVSSRGISVSPSTFGAGPIVVIVTNQTDTSQEVTFETDELGGTRPGIAQSTEPINPQGTGQLKVDVSEGRYRVRVGNGSIPPARVTVDGKRQSSQNEVLLP